MCSTAHHQYLESSPLISRNFWKFSKNKKIRRYFYRGESPSTRTFFERSSLTRRRIFWTQGISRQISKVRFFRYIECELDSTDQWRRVVMSTRIDDRYFKTRMRKEFTREQNMTIFNPISVAFIECFRVIFDWIKSIWIAHKVNQSTGNR